MSKCKKYVKSLERVAVDLWRKWSVAILARNTWDRMKRSTEQTPRLSTVTGRKAF